MTGPRRTAAAHRVDTFDSLYDGYRAKVYRVILRLVKNPSDAEDLTQETFLKVQRNLPHVKRPESVPSWLYRIATNTALDFLRQSATRRPKGSAEVPMETAEAVSSDTPSPSVVLDFNESASAIRDNANQLPDQYGVVLVLHDLEGLPLEQVAEVMGSTVGATKVRLHRARKRFAEICRVDCDQFYDEDGVLSCQLKSPTHSHQDPAAPVRQARS
jgi:RNA polymerase sigma-70 factor (ECF subfamily)